MKRVLWAALLSTAFILGFACSPGAGMQVKGAQLVIIDEDNDWYLSGGLLRFETVLNSGAQGVPAVLNASKSLTIRNIGTSRLNFVGSPAITISNQVFVSNTDSSIPNTAPSTLPFSVTTQPAESYLDPDQELQFTLDFTLTGTYADGEALATLQIESEDAEGNPMDFAFEIYGLMTC